MLLQKNLISKKITKNNKDETLVDFYIFQTKKVSLSDIVAFHVPYSYIYDFVNSSRYSEEEIFIMDIISHHKVVEHINNPDSGVEELYLSIIEYLCYGEEIRYAINSNPEGGIGIIALFNEDYHYPSITSIVQPNVNKERFYFEEV